MARLSWLAMQEIYFCRWVYISDGVVGCGFVDGCFFPRGGGRHMVASMALPVLLAVAPGTGPGARHGRV